MSVRRWRAQTIKYGVVTMDHLCKDLIEWQTLYLSGRMHKPVSSVVCNLFFCSLLTHLAPTDTP